MGSSEDELVDLITTALARIRGRGPRPPHEMHDHHAEHHAHHREHHEHHGDPRAFGRMGVAGPARFRLLEALANAASGLSIGDIAAAVGVDQPRASRLVQQAQLQGFVLREADPQDARRTRIRLTEQGERIARGFRGERRDSVRTALDGFTAEEKAEFARLLGKFVSGWPGQRRHSR